MHIARLVLAFSLTFFAAAAAAQTPLLPYREYAKRLESAEQVGQLTDAVFGAETSPANGATTFRVVDISVPGNSTLPVQLARRMEVADRTGHRPSTGGFTDWELDVPYIDGTFLQSSGWKVGSGSGTTARCSNTVPPVGIDARIWHGFGLHIPGQGTETLLINNIPGVPQLNRPGIRIRLVT